MNDFHGLLSSDFGFKPHGKSAPMAPPRPNPTTTGGSPRPSSGGSFLDDRDNLFRPPPSTTTRKPQDFSNLSGFDDVFGGGSSSSNSAGNSKSSVNLDSVFSGSGDTGSKLSSLPVFDKPVYDDDVFDGVGGIKSSGSGRYEELFSSSSKKNDALDDLLGGLGRNESQSKGLGGGDTRAAEKGIPGFDDLLNGFGGNSASAPNERTSPNGSRRQNSTARASNIQSDIINDPFVVLEPSSSSPLSSGLFNDHMEQFSNLNRSNSNKVDTSASRPVFDHINPFEGLSKSVLVFSSETSDRVKDKSPMRTEHRATGRKTFSGVDTIYNSNPKSPEKNIPSEDYWDSTGNGVENFSASDSRRSAPDTSAPSYAEPNFNETNFEESVLPKSHENTDSTDDIWLFVSEVPLFTQPTAVPPPSRPPPPRPAKFSRVEKDSFSSQAEIKVDDYSAFSGKAAAFQSSRSIPVEAKNSFVSSIDELEDFAMGRNQNNVGGSSDVLLGEDMDGNSVAVASAAAMMMAMDKAEAKLKHAKEVRERENAKAARMQQEGEERTAQDAQERDIRESEEQLDREHRERMEEEEKRRKEEEERRHIERRREEKEREQRKLERERELGRKAVERATREARERAAAESRAKAERAAVERAHAEARERAGRTAVQRAQAEARERAARDAKERAEKAAAEAREREKEEKAAADARERARAQAREKETRERAAAAARANQTKNDDDLESFFSIGSQASSVPWPGGSSSGSVFGNQFQNKQTPEDVRKSSGVTNNIRKVSSSANIVDDLSSIFGGPPSGEFQEVAGESEERQRARLERHQRTQERAAKAVAEKNQRDLQAEREQAERHRLSETLDVEIRRWATGKEGNLRALLSTLHYVLWPESGWQPVSLTDLITAASVKKVYRKATLCIHPDKVQQKGATLQQKYIAEKVFDILKEAWNKFNSEELL